MSASVPPLKDRLSETIGKLRRFCQLEVQSGWRFCDADSAVPSVNICNRPVAKLNEKGHIAWPAGKQVLHLGQQFVIPNNLHGYPVAGLRLLLGLTWWAEDAQIFVNGELVGQGDLFDCRDRVLLSSSATPGDEFLVVLRLVSPGHDAGALVRSVCLYEAADPACFDPGFVADELEILQNSQIRNSRMLNSQYLPIKILADRSLTAQEKKLKSAIDLAVELIDWSALPDREKFDRSLSVLRRRLLEHLQEFCEDFDGVNAEDSEGAERERRDEVSGVGDNGNPTSIYIGEIGDRTSVGRAFDGGTAENAEDAEGERTEEVFAVGESGNPTSIYIGEVGDRTSIYMGKIYLLGHAHLDLAWLWPVAETWEAAQRTFESALQLQSEFPELIFCHSTPALYAWIEEHRPDLFAAIKKQVAAGRWEVVGGMWVEPDLNLISGESMVRQVVFGQRYAKEKFGELMRVAWLPDTFGFGWQLPQILRQGGVDRFVTQKLRWNDTTEFPFDAFLWEGLDGSRIFSIMSAPIGEGIESVKMASYVFDWQVKTGLQAAFWLPGVGDHGGGPTRDMLEVAKRWKLSPFFPELEFAKAIDYLSAIEDRFAISEAGDRSNLSATETVEILLEIISETSAKGDVSEFANPPNLPASETVEILPGKISESSVKSDVSESDNSRKLPLTETVGDLSSIELTNQSAISESWTKSDVSKSDHHGKLPLLETVGDLSSIELTNQSAISGSSAKNDVSNSDNSRKLPVAETLGDLRSIELVNSPAISESSAKIDVSKSDKPPNLPVKETVGDLSSIELANLSAILESSAKSDVLKSDNHGKLPVAETVRDLSSIELFNLPAISESSAKIDVSESGNSGKLPVVETVEDLRSIELANSPAISETATKSDVSKSHNSQKLPVAETVGDLSSIEFANLSAISETLAKNYVSELDNPRKLPLTETVGDLSSIELVNSPAISESSAKSDVSESDNSRKLPVAETVENLPGRISESPTLPIWQDELYLEFHRGCYTTRADQKRQNRRCEDLLYQAELLSALATICAGADYPKSELETAWKQVLFNQFHDILPGSAIAPVYATANFAFAEAERACRAIMLKSLDAIADRISLPSPPQPDARPILIFNPLNWSRSEVVAIPLLDLDRYICDLSGQPLVSQIVASDRTPSKFTLLFRAIDLPPIGYRIFWLCRKTSQAFPSQAFHSQTFHSQTAQNSRVSNTTREQTELSKLTYGIAQKNDLCQETQFAGTKIDLENEFFRATIDCETGNLSGIWDKTNNREVLNAAGGNQLQAFQDSGQYWDAWNIDPNYQKYQLPAPILKEIDWVERGEVRQSLRVIQQIGKSEFCQDYIVEIGSPLLKIKTVVDWQEQHILVKTAFGLNLEAEFATCEIPCGAIERPTKPQTAAEKAKWEVPILRWVDAGNESFGVSLLNDCKYGCDIQPDRLRLTLLRGSTWPDGEADTGIHEFTCAVYPHAGNWQNAGTVRRGYELNLPLLVKELPQSGEKRDRSLPAAGSCVDLSAENLVLMAFKQSEDNSNLWILRCYESEGKVAVLELNGDLGLEIVEPVDLLERPTSLTDKLSQQPSFQIEPWKIASFAVRRATDF